MAVELQFIPPDSDDIVTLHVEEAPTSSGTFTEKQTFAAGAYPNYIDKVTVTNVTNPLDWFRVRWQDSGGAYTPYSAPIQGGTTTLVAQVQDRVILRNPLVNKIVAGQEAEATVSEYFMVDDPYSVDPAKGVPKVLSGLTLLTLARCYAIRLISGGTQQKWAAGLVSMDQGSTTNQSWDSIDRLIDLANKELGRNYSRIMLMEEITVGGGLRQLQSFDVSRAIIELA